MSIQVNLTMPEIYKALCPQCQKKLEKMVKDKVQDQVAEQVLKGEE